MVQPQLDALSAAVVLLGDPVALLGDIHAMLAQLPLDLGAETALTPARSRGMALVADHGGKLRRALAGAGAVPDQLAQLGDAVHDATVRTELTLLAREAGWQLRTLGREARALAQCAGRYLPGADARCLDRTTRWRPPSTVCCPMPRPIPGRFSRRRARLAPSDRLVLRLHARANRSASSSMRRSGAFVCGR